jgi:hypothetical protein
MWELSPIERQKDFSIASALLFNLRSTYLISDLARGPHVPELGIGELPLLQAGQKGQLRGGGRMLQAPGALRGVQGFDSLVLAQKTLASLQNLGRGLQNLSQRTYVRPAAATLRLG